MKKKTIVFTTALCAVMTLSGCGSTIPNMTTEESHIISEYAANLLLKYDKNYEVKVVDTTAYHEELRKQEEAARKAAEEAAMEAAKKEAEEAAQGSEGANGQEVEQPVVSSIEEFYQIQGVQIQYAGYGIYNSYPEVGEGEEMFFALGATDGNQLLVLNFDVKNISGAEMNLNMMDVNPKFKVSVNGGTNKNTLFTLLPEDLSAFAGALGTDGAVRTVLVTEIPASESQAINSITLTMKSEAGSAQLVLQ